MVAQIMILTNQMMSHSNEPYKYKLISKYAIAQSELGIELTYKIKRDIIGSLPLEDASIIKLEHLLKKLRREYVRLFQNKR